MNVKIGEPIWKVDMPSLPEHTMLIGADVHHNATHKKESVVGFCATMNSSFTKYYSRTLVQPKGQEIMDNLADLVEDSIIAYYI